MSKLEGKILIEILISIFILSLVALACVNLLNYGLKMQDEIEKTNSIIQDINGSISYILNEVDNADYIAQKNKYRINNSKWLNLAIIKEDPTKISQRFNYITYTVNEDKILQRRSFTSQKKESYVDEAFFKSSNNLLEGVDQFDCSFDEKSMMLTIRIKLVDHKDIFVYEHYIKGVYLEK